MEISELNSDARLKISDLSKRVHKVMSLRLQELSTSELKMKAGLSKSMAYLKPGEDYTKSKWAKVISSLRYQLHSVNEVYNSALEIISLIIDFMSSLNDTYHLTGEKRINLSTQLNYNCLKNTLAESTQVNTIQKDKYMFIKQKSTPWKDLRKKFPVTGSTAYTALGADTLKKQREHVTDKLEPKDVVITAAMQHGIDNEIHATGTLLTTVLPLYFPSVDFYEHGCDEVSIVDCKKLFLASADGIGKIDGKNVIAYEFKCPYPDSPGKKYTTNLHYSIPVRYIPQVNPYYIIF